MLFRPMTLLISQEPLCNLLLVRKLWILNLASVLFLLSDLLLCLDRMQADSWDLDRILLECALVLSALSVLLEHFINELLDRNALDATDTVLIVTLGAAATTSCVILSIL